MLTTPTRVLLVEDDSLEAKNVANTLAADAPDEFEICGVARLSEALGQLNQRNFDVVLLSFGASARDGLETLIAIRSDHAQVPVVVLSSFDDTVIARSALERGAQDYLSRQHFSSDLLEQAIRCAIRRQHTLGTAIEHEHAVHEAEARKSAILESALDAIITIDCEGTILEFNPAAEKTFGYSRAEIIGRAIVEAIVPPCYRLRHMNGLARCVETGESRILNQRIELTALRSDGTEFPIELTIARIPINGPAMFTAYIRDISDRKQAEAALEEQVQLSALTARIGVVLTRSESLPVMLRDCCETITRQLDAAFTRIWTLNSSQDVLELQASAGMYTHLNGSHSRVAVGQLKIGKIAQERLPHLTNVVIGDPRVGDQDWAKREGMVAFAGYPLISQDRLVGVIGMFARHKLSAVTIKALEAVADGIAMGIERCRVADELRASQERFTLAVQGSTDGLWDWNILTGDAYMSPRLAQMLGYEEGDLENRFSTWESRLHPDDREKVMATVQTHLSQRLPFVVDHRLRTKSGEYRWFCSRGQALWNQQGEPFRMAGSLTDITQRVHMETVLAERDRQLRQSQKLEAVGSLAGGIAHEFNNLLQAIRGYTKLAIEALPIEAQPRQDLEQVEKAADRASALTRQLLGFSRHQVFKPAVLDPNTLVSELTKLLRPLIQEDIELAVALADNVGTLLADPGLLQQMLLNLCINARDAMPSGGKLTLKTERIALNSAYCELHPASKPGSYVVLSVADTGCGMSPQVRDRIFEPFFTTKEVGRGTGLGLSMVYGTVQQHGGMINVYSEPGIGTTFRIYLPIVGAEEVENDRHECADCRGGSETILVAEDEPIVRQLAERVLKEAGYALLIASDGAEAIELFETHADTVSLALVDAIMPTRTGREVYETIKRDRPNLPVVMCTAYDPHAGQLKFLSETGLRVLQKPFDPSVLLQTIRAALDAQQPCDMTPCLK